jgi:hypothetical protein
MKLRLGHEPAQGRRPLHRRREPSRGHDGHRSCGPGRLRRGPAPRPWPPRPSCHAGALSVQSAHVVHEAHRAVGRYEEAIALGLQDDDRRRPLLTATSPGRRQEVARLVTDPVPVHGGRERVSETAASSEVIGLRRTDILACRRDGRRSGHLIQDRPDDRSCAVAGRVRPQLLSSISQAWSRKCQAIRRAA